MALRVLPELTEFIAQDHSKGVFVVESDNPDFGMAIHELTHSSDAKNVALAAGAAHGLTRIEGLIGGAYYAVNSSGERVLQAMQKHPDNPQHPDCQPYRYRMSVRLTRPLL